MLSPAVFDTVAGDQRLTSSIGGSSSSPSRNNMVGVHHIRVASGETTRIAGVGAIRRLPVCGSTYAGVAYFKLVPRLKSRQPVRLVISSAVSAWTLHPGQSNLRQDYPEFVSHRWCAFVGIAPRLSSSLPSGAYRAVSPASERAGYRISEVVGGTIACQLLAGRVEPLPPS